METILCVSIECFFIRISINKAWVYELNIEKSAEMYAFPSWHLNYLKFSQSYEEWNNIIDSPKTYSWYYSTHLLLFNVRVPKFTLFHKITLRKNAPKRRIHTFILRYELSDYRLMILKLSYGKKRITTKILNPHTEAYIGLVKGRARGNAPSSNLIFSYLKLTRLCLLLGYLSSSYDNVKKSIICTVHYKWLTNGLNICYYVSTLQLTNNLNM